MVEREKVSVPGDERRALGRCQRDQVVVVGVSRAHRRFAAWITWQHFGNVREDLCSRASGVGCGLGRKTRCGARLEGAVAVLARELERA